MAIKISKKTPKQKIYLNWAILLLILISVNKVQLSKARYNLTFFFHSTQRAEQKKNLGCCYINYPMLVQQSLLSYCIVIGGLPPPTRRHRLHHWLQVLIRYQQTTVFPACRSASFCRTGCSKHEPDVGRLLLNRPILPDICHVCSRLKIHNL